MTEDGVLNHDELLTLAYKVEAAATDHDRARLASAANRLYDEITAHLTGERADLLHIPPREERLLARGQARVIDLLLDVALCAETSGEACVCEGPAQRLVAQLEVQAHDERVAGMGLIGVASHREDG